MPFNSIKSLLNPEILYDIDQSGKQVTLKEKLQNSKRRSIISIGGLSSNTIIFKLDKNKKGFTYKSGFLNPAHIDIHKGCDYVIITEHKKRQVIVFCELKSGKISGGKDQLFYSVPFIDYLASLVKTHKRKSIEAFERHFVIFSNSGKIKKQNIKNKKLQSYRHKNIKVKHARNHNKINIGRILQ